MAGELNRDDLQFVLTVAANTAPVDEALAAVGKQIDDTAAKISPSFMRNLFKSAKDIQSLLLSALMGGAGTAGQVGGLLGGAFAGAGGAILGGAAGRALGAAPGAAGAALGAPAQAVNAGLNQISAALRAMQGNLGPVAAGLDLVGAALSSVSNVLKSIPVIGTVVGPLSDALASIPGLFRDITGTLVDFAAKASPGVFRTWTKALEDVQGVIGQAFVPVLEVMRDGVRLFGDVLANVLPNMSEVRAALGEFRNEFAGFGTEIRDILREIGPQIRGLVISGLQQLAHWLAVATRAAVLMAERLRQYFGGAAPGGTVKPSTEPLRTSFGASYQQPRMEGALEYERNLQLAFAGLGGGPSKEDQNLARLDDIVGIDQEAKDLLATIDVAVSGIGSTISEGVAIARSTYEVMKTVVDWLKSIYDRLPELKPNQTIENIGDNTTNALLRGLSAEGARGRRLDAAREEMRAAHPEYFSTGTVGS